MSLTHGTFFRQTTDKQRLPANLDQSFASPAGASCWLVGGGPSLATTDLPLLQSSPAPKMCLNLAGTGVIRPQFWTAYDPTSRFSRSTYLDPGVMKFVPRRRAMDLVPETTYKVCECPNLYCFEGDSSRGFQNFVAAEHSTIVDWNDTFVQAIDILYQLGFRTIYLVGCELQIFPSAAMRGLAGERGVPIREGCSLSEFVKLWEKQGFSRKELAQLERPAQYHFEERKPLASAISTDFHYDRVVQFLRLSRVALSLAGLRLVSVTPESRLNAFFPACSLAEAAAEILEQTGDPHREQTQGRYTGTAERGPRIQVGMRDFLPLHWAGPGQPQAPGEKKRLPKDKEGRGARPVMAATRKPAKEPNNGVNNGAGDEVDDREFDDSAELLPEIETQSKFRQRLHEEVQRRQQVSVEVAEEG